MIRIKHHIFFYLLLSAAVAVFSCTASRVQAKKLVWIVDPSGKGDFTSIQQAINSLPDSSAETRSIRIRRGTYREKLFISKHNLVLEGANREGTIITQDIARDEWRCGHADDWGAATVNLNGNDITLLNLTIENGYGFHTTVNRTVACASEVSGKKEIPPTGHQMALRTMASTRMKAVNCRFRSRSGDTVSPWNVENGMFYFRDCIMEGGVDLYCPRGWAWAENCVFLAHAGTAILWHDGSSHEASKTVLKNCNFDGYEGFYLGRYHRDAQFFLVNCKFASNMADREIYRVPTDNNIKWGHRVYYWGCEREGGNYQWFSNRLPASLKPSDITVSWLFGGKWQPDREGPLKNSL